MQFWLLIIGAAIVAWIIMTKRGPAAMFSSEKARTETLPSESVTFDDVAGVDEAKEELQQTIDFLKDPDRYARLGARIPKGVLLVGPPGTGKTLLARATAGEAQVPFFHLAASGFSGILVGLGVSRVKDLFKRAKASAPCIIFIDELDALGKARTGFPTAAAEDREQTLNQLLVEMDNYTPASGLIFMAATNRPEILDQALMRPGRFDRHIVVDRPDKAGREAILALHSRKVTLDDTVDLSVLAGRTPGFAGADLENLVNEAALLAARSDRDSVLPEDFDEAIDRVLMGLKKANRAQSPAARRLRAYHELGHAVVAEVLPEADSVVKVTIIPRGVSLGLTAFSQDEERLHLMTETALRHTIAVLLGGRAAELIFMGEASTGAADDLQRATQIASDMVRKFGMSPLGLRTFDRHQQRFVNDEMLPQQQSAEHGSEAAANIDREVDRIILDGLELAKRVLTRYRDTVDKVAIRLLEEQTLTGEELRSLLGMPPRSSEDASPAESDKDNASVETDQDAGAELDEADGASHESET